MEGDVGEQEVDADELAASVTAQLGELNQDLALLAPVFEALEPGRRAELLEQLRYAAELVAYFEEDEEAEEELRGHGTGPRPRPAAGDCSPSSRSRSGG